MVLTVGHLLKQLEGLPEDMVILKEYQNGEETFVESIESALVYPSEAGFDVLHSPYGKTYLIFN